VGLSGFGTTALYLAPAGESAAVEQLQFLDNAVVIGLVKGYKYRFHIVSVFVFSLLVDSRLGY
jgi:hypothetical protein